MAEPTVTELQARSQITESGCWEWQGPRLPQGYGRFGRSGYAHRVAWSIANGREIPAGSVIMHICDNPPCCNPEHLRLGTQAENIRDRDQKGRQARGVQPGRRVISEDTIRELRRLRATGMSQRNVAVHVGVSRGTVEHYTCGPRANDYPGLAA